MKIDFAKLSLCLILSFAVVLVGCGKKSDEGNNNGDKEETPAVNLSDIPSKAKEAAEKTAAETARIAEAAKEEVVDKFADIAAVFQADKGKTVEEVTTQAKEMAADKLREISQIYRDAIEANRQKLKEMAEQLRDTPEAERASAEVKKLKAEIDRIHDSIPVLKEKFEVYYNSLKEKAGDLTGLDI
jgi:ubiquinone biosynthesis protein UbiJ